MRVVFELSDKDIRWFRDCLRAVKDGRLASDEPAVIAAARRLMEEVAASEAPEYVQSQIAGLRALVEMLEDDRWRIGPPERARIRNALAYFVDPDDMIPDSIPGIGFLDDAIMVALVLEEFQHEIAAYEDFRRFEGPPEKVEQKRIALQKRMRSQRRSEAERRKLVKGGKRGLLGLWR